MNALRIRKTIDGENLYLPELRDWAGKDVEIIILEESPPSSREPLETMGTFLGLAPPELTPVERAANIEQIRRDAGDNPEMLGFLKAIEDKDAFDVDLIVKLRAMPWY